jgi:hypothetical protein
LPKKKARPNKKCAAIFGGARIDAIKISTSKKCPFHRHLSDVSNFVQNTASNKKYFCFRQWARALFASTEDEAIGSYTQD